MCVSSSSMLCLLVPWNKASSSGLEVGAEGPVSCRIIESVAACGVCCLSGVVPDGSVELEGDDKWLKPSPGRGVAAEKSSVL